MKPKAKPESKIPTTGRNTNQKKKVKNPGGFDLGGSLLKMNEFTLIMVGALVVTVLVFFLFFRSPDPDDRGREDTLGAAPQPAVAADPRMEQRIADLEVSLSRLAASSPMPEAPVQGDAKAVSDLDQRVTRLERAMTLKLDGLMDRLAKMEKRVAALKQAPAAVKPAAKLPKPVAAVSQKAPLKKKAVQTTKKKKTNIFHTVKKGETLWSISQKYKTSVAALRKLNNMTAKDNIYPGNNILVR
ncbi:MAG: LysM peptidoglycan-binding domain-containing protein [Desulfobacter sp.]|nr:MAG: LysM peptidoglycan-binding domain-containing protein [Desulfobacter sp.]